MALLLLIVVILFSHQELMVEGKRHVHETKYYPDEPPVKTITLDDGDVIDCVEFYSQPAMRNPFIRSNPKFGARIPQPKATSTMNSSSESTSSKFQGTGQNGRGCPLGTVPFLKATKAGPLNLSAVASFTRSRAQHFMNDTMMKNAARRPKDREYAIARAEHGFYTGAEGTLNVWQPVVEEVEEMSISQIWLYQETSDDYLATLEAGWMVHPLLYGDMESRFFFLTTPDSYQTMLYNDNLAFPHDSDLKFVRVSEKMPNGQRINRPSVYQGRQREMTIAIKQDDEGDWSLLVNGDLIGYWPKSNYRDGFLAADGIHWGGEVKNLKRRGRHSRTEMGSGHFSEEGTRKAAYISNMGTYDFNKVLSNAPNELSIVMTNPTCYTLTDWGYDRHLRRYITMGGPGFNDNCP